MVTRIIFLLILIPFSMEAQITSAQQKALNSYIEYANKSGEEEVSVFGRIKTYYEDLQQYRTSKYKRTIRFTCPVQLEDYYYNTALKSSVGADDATLKSKLQALRKAAEEIDLQCKALDTYHKLEDYKTDDYKKAEELINTLLAKLIDYRTKRTGLYTSVQSVYNKLQTSKTGAYATTVKQMHERIDHETELLNSWNYNLDGKTHSGWPVEKLKQHILVTQELVNKKVSTAGIQYPASSMISSFEEGLSMLQQTKRNGLDRYNYEAQKSDEHSNGVYLDLINTYNGVLVSFYNTFVGYAQNDYKALLVLTYVPAFEIRSQQQIVEFKTEPFQDIAYIPVTVSPRPAAIDASAFRALSNYIDYINESVRQTDHLQRLYSNLYGSTNYYRDLTSYKGKGGLTFDLKDFEIPVSYLQKTIAESRAVPEAYRKSLNDQAEVLMRIMNEMNQLSIALDQETEQKKYEKDNLKRLDEIVMRYKTITDLFHEKKEVLYSDVRKIFESYKVADPAGSWNKSGKALLQLVDADKVELFKARAFYLGDQTQKPDADKIQNLIRSIISDEYTNLKGIEKIGRNNGNCPYTPYEDLPSDSKKFTEPEFKVSNLSPLSYSHPYHSYVYMFNEVARNYNKFCELAKIPMLQTIYEPELFILERGPKPPQRPDEFPVRSNAEQKPVIANHLPETSVPGSQSSLPVDPKNTSARDTIFIEKHDTIYLDRPDESVRSMEGYATNNMVLLLDVSGSMNRADRLPLLKKSVLDLLGMMREEDELSVVVFSGKPQVLLEPVSFKEQEKIRKAIGKLQSKGTTDGNSAIALAFQVADKNYIRAGNNRIILATDGEFPVSEETLKLIERFAKDDIFITVFNFGTGSGSAKSLEQIAALGKGNYELVTPENVDSKLVHEAKSKRKK
jgi:Ca-activated chloride channel homolog